MLVPLTSKNMLVNGVTINMDVAPELRWRTMLPIHWLGQTQGLPLTDAGNAHSSHAVTLGLKRQKKGLVFLLKLFAVKLFLEKRGRTRLCI